MRISDWSSDVCSSDLENLGLFARHLTSLGFGVISREGQFGGLGNFRETVKRFIKETSDFIFVRTMMGHRHLQGADEVFEDVAPALFKLHQFERSEEHTSELQSLMRTSYAVFCLKKKNSKNTSENVPTHRSTKPSADYTV